MLDDIDVDDEEETFPNIEVSEVVHSFIILSIKCGKTSIYNDLLKSCGNGCGNSLAVRGKCSLKRTVNSYDSKITSNCVSNLSLKHQNCDHFPEVSRLSFS